MLVTGQQILINQVSQQLVSNQRLQYFAKYRCEAHWVVVAGILPVPPFVDRNHLCQGPVSRNASCVHEPAEQVGEWHREGMVSFLEDTWM